MPFDGTDISLGQLGLTEISPTRVLQWRQHVCQRYRKIPAAHWAIMPRFLLADFSGLFPSAPKSVRQLSKMISGVMPDVTCTVHYFDTDPILYANIGDKRYCIAIWDMGVVRALAGGATLPIGQRLLRQLVKTV